MSRDRASPRDAAIGLRPVFLRAIADIGVFSLLINILLLVIPLYLLQVYDRVLPSSSVETLLYLSAMAVVALAFLGLLDAVRLNTIPFYAFREPAVRAVAGWYQFLDAIGR